jgi:hypothetical protein
MPILHHSFTACRLIGSKSQARNYQRQSGMICHPFIPEKIERIRYAIPATQYLT